MIWDIIFTSPEDENWHLVSNTIHYGLHHDCTKGSNPMVQKGRGCVYCYEKPPEALWGMYQLARWDR